MKSDITNDTYNSDGVECPYCGYVDKDSWELGNGGEGCGEIECPDCDKIFIWQRVVSIDYIGREKK